MAMAVASLFFPHASCLPHRVLSAPFLGSPLLADCVIPAQHTRKRLSVRAETQSRGLSKEQGGRWLSSVTRHIRIYAGYIDPVTLAMDQSQLDKLSLILDPDSEFVWPEDKCQKVYGHFAELVDNYAGAPLTEYTLRLIGSELENLIRKMLLAGEIKYNLNCRVLNFSMGKPRLNMEAQEVT